MKKKKLPVLENIERIVEGKENASWDVMEMMAEWGEFFKNERDSSVIISELENADEFMSRGKDKDFEKTVENVKNEVQKLLKKTSKSDLDRFLKYMIENYEGYEPDEVKSINFNPDRISWESGRDVMLNMEVDYDVK